MGHDARGEMLRDERRFADGSCGQSAPDVCPSAVLPAVVAYQRALVELARTDFPDLAAAFRSITATTARTLGVERVSIWRMTETGDLVCADLYRRSASRHEAGPRMPAAHLCQYLPVLEDVRVLVAPRARTDPRTAGFLADYLEPLDIHSLMDAPVRRGGRLVGVVCHEQTVAPRDWLPADEEFAAAVADLVGMALEAEERRQTERALQDSESRFRRLFTASPDAIFVEDLEGRVLLANPAAARLHGLRPDQLVGSHVVDLVPPEWREQTARDFPRLVSGEIDGAEGYSLGAGGLRIPVELRVTRLEHEGRPSLLLHVRDITQRRQTEDQLRLSSDRLHALAARLQRVRDEESVRIAREIHDELGQAMTGLKMDLSWLEQHMTEPHRASDGTAIRTKLGSMRRVVDVTLQAVRRICSELRPTVLDTLGLVAAIEWQTQEFQRRTGTRCRLSLPRRPLRVDSTRSTAVYRIYQEILTNVARHAHARRLGVRLASSPAAELILEVRDNGRGISADEIASGRSLGLMGMRERAALVGGRVEVAGTPGRGTTVRVVLPGAVERALPLSTFRRVGATRRARARA